MFGQRPGTALVSGGTGGIGAAICRRLAEEDSTVHFTYRSAETAAAELLGELRAHRASCSAAPLDLTDADAVKESVDAAAATHGGIHTLIHAAGPHVPMVHLSRVSPVDFARQVHIDVDGFFNLISAALPHLRESRGSVVVVSTAATSRYPKRDGLSSGPKAAVEALARGFAAEEGRFGVRVNCVGPGMLTDGMAERLIANGDLDEAALAITRENIPLRRFGSALDIAEAALFLASDRAGFISGQKLDVDGGYGV
ncbi:SDR family NAD(P)-dependent oxidoreductase [Nocardioides sp. Bht2]|uniref:SDR family NAD(P)-dependent oxidoreductase n=1 Tax=Nocardioides sp. Bht2 TaxID=3392297 RepID=UPI0039B3D37E